jgi:uncharacterized protein (DUF58 family)
VKEMKQSNVSRWLLAIAIVVGLAGRIISGSLVYTRLMYLGILLAVGAAIWATLSSNGITLKRNTRSLRASMGDIFEEHYEIRKVGWPGCTWLEVFNQSNLPGASGSRLFTRIGAGQSRFYSARTILAQRGSFLLGPTRLSSGDPFGIFIIRKVIPAKESLVILPMTFPIATFPPPPGLLPGGKTIHQRSSDVTPHAAEVREYVPGDPMKRIHWRSTAHRGQFMVKEFELDPQADIWLFLDAFKTVHSSLPSPDITFDDENKWLRRPKISLPPDTFEYAISVTASLAKFFLLDRRKVGLVCSAGKFIVVSEERGERQINKIMETLAFLKPEGKLPLYGLVSLHVKNLPFGSGVLLISPSAHSDLLLAVEDVQRRHLRPIIILIRSETFGGVGGTDKMVASLLSRNIPVCQVGFGDDLGASLSLPAVYFQRIATPKPYQ